MHRKLSSVSTAVLISILLAASASADHPEGIESDDFVTWMGGPCTEPVLMVDVDKENVRGHIPPDYPRSDDDFMDHVVTTVGVDGRLKATVVITLNQCRDNAITITSDGTDRPTQEASDVAEVLVMILWDGPSTNAFEFYALASYVNDSSLDRGYSFLGLPVTKTSEMIFDLEANPEEPDPGAVVPFLVEVPGVFRAEGQVTRPLTYGPAGHATHHYDGPRGAIWVEHDAPTGGSSTAQATFTVTGDDGAWLADLFGATQVDGEGPYLEKEVGHGHTAYLLQ